METGMTAVIDNFISYIGTGWMGWMFWGLYCLALIICLVTDRDNSGRLVSVSLILAVVVFNPIFYTYVGDRFLSGVYWRLFWVFPLVITIACVATQLISRFRFGAVRLIVAFIFAVSIALLGQSVINRGTYTIAENDYQIPQRAIDVADVILADSGGARVSVVATDDLVCYIRQYSPRITLAYGRDMWGFIGVPDENENYVYNAIHTDSIDYEELIMLSRLFGHEYIVFDVNLFDIPENIEDMGYRLVDYVDDYVIYRVEEV
jgi:hypothetical protein